MAKASPLLTSFEAVGRDMFVTGLVSSHSGSMSVTVDGKTTVTRGNAMLGRLHAEDLIELSPEGEPAEETPDDALVHRAIYRMTQAKAIIHARPPATMALALIDDRLAPANGEGADAFGTVPVAISQRALNSIEVADLMGQMLKETRVAVLRGRGVFAWGDDLDSALHMVSLLEEMCRVACYYRTMTHEEEQPQVQERNERSASNLSPYRTPRDGNNRRPVRQGGGNGPRRPGGGGGGPQGGGGNGPRPGGGGPPRRPSGDNRGGSFRPS